MEPMGLLVAKFVSLPLGVHIVFFVWTVLILLYLFHVGMRYIWEPKSQISEAKR